MKAWKDALALAPSEGEALFVGGGLGVRFMIDGDETDGRFSLVEHPLAPRYLAAPLHRHGNEDEFSYILEGTVGAQIGDRVLTAPAGTLVYKPRRIWHTFWNAGDEPARILEIISPAGFESFFRGVGQFFPENAEPDINGFLMHCGRYSLEMDMESVAGLQERHGLQGM